MMSGKWQKRLLILGIVVLSALVLAECVIIGIMVPML